MNNFPVAYETTDEILFGYVTVVPNRFIGVDVTCSITVEQPAKV